MNSYVFKNTSTTALFRPYPSSGEPANSTFLINSSADLKGVYTIDGYIKWE